MWTFPYFGESKELNEATRSSAPGSFVRILDGWTHYELGGPLDGQPVVLVHGFSVPYFIWDPTFAFLTASGFRVLRYDLFGRGFSDRPDVRYDIELFCKQLRELVDILGFEQLHLIGLSLGGPITSTFAARYPERVRKLVLVDPCGARPVTFAQVLKAAISPVLGEVMLSLFGRGWLSNGVKSDFYNPANIKTFVDSYKVQMQYKGFMRAILSTMRYGMLGDFTETYRKVGEQGTPVLLLWGRDDKTVPFSQSEDVCAAIPQAEFHAFERCAHIPHYEKPEEVNPILLEFLK